MLDLTSLISRVSLPDGFWLLAQETAEKTQETAAPAAPLIWPKFLFLFAVIAAALTLGSLCARLTKMKKDSGRFTTVWLVLILGLSPFLWRSVWLHEPLSANFNWGIDLAGGTNMVFEVDTKNTEKTINSDVMDQMVSAIRRRINPSGAEEVTVRKVGALRIEVTIPGADQELVEAKKKLISRLGSLEFGILANTVKDDAIIKKARRMPLDQDILREAGQVKAAWRDPGRTADGKGFKEIGKGGRIATREVNRNGEKYDQYLVLVDPPDRRITGENLSNVMPTTDPKNGRPAVSFSLDSAGARNMRMLTSSRRPTEGGQFHHRLAILLDETVHQAPNINEILSNNIQVTGLDSSAEAKELVSVLNAGALKVPLKPNPISEFSISPLLGQDVQDKGLKSITIAAIVVFVFMAVYYLRAGFIADVCLLMNLVLVAACMSVFDATITLPGLAGLVLTIGMAVDANVLIFERIREEKDRGSSMRMAIQNGFSKAFSTIVDANVTTLITAAILFSIGSDAVKGFAVMLFIGIVMSMFSALYFGRLLFDIGEKLKINGDLKMLSVVGKTNWNFIGKKKLCAIFSLALIVGGMSAFVVRGQDNLDIDFTGGTMITFQLNKPADVDTVRSILEDKFKDITLESLSLQDTPPEERGKIYRMRTRLRDAEPGADKKETIRQMVGEAFEGKSIQPRRVKLEYGPIGEIPTDATQAKQEDDAFGEIKDKDGKTPSDAAGGPQERFPGGHRVTLTFSDEFKPDAPAEVRPEVPAVEIANQLGSSDLFKDENGNPIYDKPSELIHVVGTKGAGVNAGLRDAKTFSEFELDVSSSVSVANLQKALAAVQTSMKDNPTFDEVNSFDSSVAGEMKVDAVMAILASMVAIVFYIWLRFDKVTFGLAAVAALVHDVLVVLGLVAVGSLLAGNPVGGFFGLTDFKINLPMIAAFLTIVGYSLNDTIVVFDRIREVRGKSPAMTESMVNLSLNQTLSRTLLTSFTTLIVVVILYCWGGEGIHGFAYCLVLGVLVGTYSSIYVASPVLLWLINRPGSEIGLATAKAEAEEAARAEKQTAA